MACRLLNDTAKSYRSHGIWEWYVLVPCLCVPLVAACLLRRARGTRLLWRPSADAPGLRAL